MDEVLDRKHLGDSRAKINLAVWLAKQFGSDNEQRLHLLRDSISRGI